MISWIRRGWKAGLVSVCWAGLAWGETLSLEEQTQPGGAFEAQQDWRRVLGPREWEFPRDHGAHPDYRTEWWYFTGNVFSESGEHFGYQLTFFRHGLQWRPLQTGSSWAARDLYFAHFGLTDVQRRHFFHADQAFRGTLGLAYARQGNMELKNGSWTVEPVEGEFRLRAIRRDHALDLVVRPVKPLVLQGENGFSRKGSQPGNASSYYSMTRLHTEGTLTIRGREVAVRGTSWFDHEFSTSLLERGQKGWNWFSIQLDDGHELMAYRMCRTDGQRDAHDHGVWVWPDGSSQRLGGDDYKIRELGRWTSPKTGAVYPQGWEITVPILGLQLVMRAALPDQEVIMERMGGLAYWEGACVVEGQREGRQVRGFGYAELTGYHRSMEGPMTDSIDLESGQLWSGRVAR